MKTRTSRKKIDSREEIAKRILEERSRLGLTQKALAEQMGSSRVSIVKYESGETLPSAEALVAFEQLGIDVRYVLVGAHGLDTAVVRERFRRAFLEVGRQAKANREQLSDEQLLELTWRIYDAFSALESTGG